MSSPPAEAVRADTSSTPAGSRVRAWLAAGPAYPPDAGDLRTVSVIGLQLPVRATVAVVVVAVILLLDYHGRIDEVVRALLGPLGSTVADAKRVQSLGRLALEGLVPLLVVILVFRDSPGRYGLRRR